MKKIAIILAALLLLNSTSSFSQRNYRNVKYTKTYYANDTDDYGTITIKWKDDNASSIDNIDYIVYPYGYIIPYTTAKFYTTLNSGYSVFRMYAKDENKLDIECFITKYSERRLGFMIWYSKNLYYSFTVDLVDFLY